MIRLTRQSVWLLVALLAALPSASSTLPFEQAVVAAKLSAAAYCNVSDWTCGPCSASDVWVVFRGTDGFSISNWMTDAHMKRTSFDLCSEEQCQVHSGFLAASASLSAGIEAALEKLGGNTVRGKASPQARTSYRDCWSRLPPPTHPVQGYNVREVFALGGPRVGDAAWVGAYKKAMGGALRATTYRIVVRGDPVSQLPPYKLGFRHTPHEVWFSAPWSDVYKECSDDSGEDQQCSFSLSAAFLAAHASDHGVYLNQTNGGVTCNQGPKALQAVRGVMAKALPRAPPSLSDLALRPGPMLEAQGQDAEN